MTENVVPVKKETSDKEAGQQTPPATLATHPLASLRQEVDRLFERFAEG